MSEVDRGGNGVGVRALFDQMLKWTRRSVGVQTRLLMEVRDQNQRLDRLGIDTREGRDEAVKTLTTVVVEAVKEGVAQADSRRRRDYIMLGVAIVVAQALGVPIGALLEKLIGLVK